MKWRIGPKQQFEPTPEMRILIPIFIVSSFLFGILASLVANGVTDPFDTATLLWINQHASPILDTFFIVVTQLGGVLFVTSVSIILAALLFYKKQYTRVVFVTIGIGGAALLGAIFKAVFERTRPDLWEWLVTETSFSFPSGHATASMALALVMCMLLWRTKWRIAAVICGALYVGLVSLSRLYLGVHFPTDILGGWLLSIGWISLIGLACLYAASGRTKVRL